MDGPKKRFAIPIVWEIVIMNLVLMLPAAMFWTSLILRLALGTDYYFDIVFEELGMTYWGNVVLNTMVIFLPGISIGLNGMVYLSRRTTLTRWFMVLGVVFLAAGFLAAVKRN